MGLGAATGTLLAGCSAGSGDGTTTSGDGDTAEAQNQETTETSTGAPTTTPVETTTTTETTTATQRATATEATTTTETTTATTQASTPTATSPASEENTEVETTTEASDGPTGTTVGTTVTSSGNGFGPETFSDSGTSTVEELELATGPITAEYTYGGESNFIVTLLTLEGESYQDVSLTNAIGPANGSQVATVGAAGGHNLNVETEGEWEITLEQPSDPQAESLPIDASGEGPSYIGPFEFSGPTTFQGSHSGEENFIVTPIPVDPSNMMAAVFNEIGQFEGETTSRVNGLTYLNINADGEWSLSTG